MMVMMMTTTMPDLSEGFERKGCCVMIIPIPLFSSASLSPTRPETERHLQKFILSSKPTVISHLIIRSSVIPCRFLCNESESSLNSVVFFSFLSPSILYPSFHLSIHPDIHSFIYRY